MKNTIKIIALFLSLGIIASCDKVEFPFTTGSGSQITQDTIRKVLLEDFTGHTCVNCPSSHKTAEDLQKVYGDQLIVVAIHAGFFAKPKAAPYDNDYRTTEGTDLYNFFGVVATPIGMVNRVKQSNGGYLVDKGAFGTEISKQIDSLPLAPDVFIELDATYNSNDSTVDLNADLSLLKDLPAGKYNLCVMLTESGIISAQKNSDANVGATPEILDYEHKHMLRGMLTPTFGVEVLNGAGNEGQKISKSFTGFKMGKSWVTANCHIVAFLYYADGSNAQQIIQAEEIPVL